MIEIERSKLGLSKVERIHHVSDIHIRNYKRHSEYNRVFERLYAKIRSNVTDRDLIVLTGDIVHSKTDVTPELFNEVQKFLNCLCEIAPVLMIPGNHDANLNNSHRLDALSPIVNAMNNPRLHYAKESSIIRMGNVDFYHWSVFDDIKNYPVPFEDSQTKIALFHGPVNNCFTEAGYQIENESITVDSFRGFDIALLGDIHKLQFMNPQKTIAYPGSLIQQNHGEERRHGYLLWEVESRYVEFVEIDNDTAFYTLDVEEGVHKPIDETLPENLYLRIRYKNTDQSQIRSITESIKESKNVVELTTQRISSFVSRERVASSHRSVDFRSTEQQNLLITKYLKHKHNLKEEDLTRVLEINEQTNKSLKKTDVPRNSMWVPKRFEFENMFSYGKGNYVDFTDMKGTYGLFAPNASGKSTLLDSLTYCLFDKCTKTSRGHQVMNANSDKFYCKLEFELNGLDYVIERRARKQSNANVRVEVDFYYTDEKGEKVSLNGKDRSDTNTNIKNVLGTYEDFVLTTLSTQSNNTGFIDMNQKDRKDLLSQFMDIGVFEELYNVANESGKENAAVLRHYQKTNYEERIKELKKSLESDKELLKTESQNRDLLEASQAEYNKLLVELSSQLLPVDSSIVDEKVINQSLKEAKEDIEKCKTEIKQTDATIHSLAIEIDDLQFRINNVKESELNERVSECSNKKKQLHQLEIELQKLESHVTHKKDKLGKLEELEYDPNCSYCMNNVFVKDAISVKDQIKQDTQKLNQLKADKKELEIEIEKCGSVEEVKQSYEHNLWELSKKQNELSKLSAQLEKLNNRSLQSHTKVKDFETKIETREKQVSAIKHNQEIAEKLNETKTLLKQTDSFFKSLSTQCSDLLAQIRVAEKSLKDIETEINKRNELEKHHRLYQYYLEAVHRDGIPHDVISVTIPQIEEEVNNILSQLVDFKIVFETDDKNVNAFIAYSEEKYWPLELTSGMEKFVSSLAIRTSLINVSSLPRPNFVAIDEGFGTLDRGNLGSMSLLFEYLKTQFRFLMVISHIDSMRDIVDDYIEVQKVDGRSSVKHG